MVWVQAGKNKRDIMSGRSMCTRGSKPMSVVCLVRVSVRASPRDMEELKALNVRQKS